MISDGSATETMNAAEALLAPALAMEDLATPAIVAGDREVSYPELASAVARAGHTLRDLGVGRQDRLILLVDDRPEFFYAYIGAQKIGAVPIALNLRITAKELTYIIEDCGAKLLVVDPEFLSLAKEAVGAAPQKPPIILTEHRPDSGFNDLPALMHDRPDDLTSQLMAPDEMALWMYTSGTTGRPKAVVHMVKSIYMAERYFGPEFGIGPGDIVFSSSKLFFAYSLGHVLLAGLRLGATLVLHAGWPTAEDIAQVIAHRRPDVVLTVPTLYRNLLRDGLAEADAFGNVRHFISAGEHLPESLFHRWLEATGRPIIDCIGSTENLILFIGNRPDDYCPGSSGKPMPHTDAKLMTEAGEPIEGDDAPGVLWVKTDTLAAGYWGQRDKTEAVFKEGWYCTNDVFTRDAAGWYFYQGRADDMLKVSGQWVSPAEIEAHVDKNPKVSQAVVVGVENEEGLVRLALCLVPVDQGIDRAELETEITDELTAHLSIYKCPRRFVYVDEMPQTATGKVQRFKVRDIVAAEIAQTQS